MNNIDKSRAEEIVRLHHEVAADLRQSLAKAIRIGELLRKQKESLKPGAFTPWVKANLPFTDRIATRYMAVYEKRDTLKTDTVFDLREAYKLLKAPEGYTIGDRHQVVKVKDIEPNPFWDMASVRIPFTWVKSWQQVLGEAGDPLIYPDAILVVRPQGNRYQLVCQHQQLAALRILQIEEAVVFVIELDDEQMKESLRFEPTEALPIYPDNKGKADP